MPRQEENWNKNWESKPWSSLPRRSTGWRSLYKTCSTRTPPDLASVQNTTYPPNPTAVTSHFFKQTTAMSQPVRQVLALPGPAHCWREVTVADIVLGLHRWGESSLGSCAAPDPGRRVRADTAATDQRLFHNLHCTPLPLLVFFRSIFLVSCSVNTVHSAL